MVEIKDIKENMKSIVVEGYLIEKSERRLVQGKYDGKTYDVCNFLLSATKEGTKETSITLTLWDADIDRFRISDKVKITNGYATTFQGNIQLNVGKFGQIKLA